MKTIAKFKMVCLACATLGAPAFAPAADDATENRGQLSPRDYTFACDAALGSMMEVKAGELAQIKGSDPMVKEFGARMIADHAKAAKELAALASRKGATLPADLDGRNRERLELPRGDDGSPQRSRRGAVWVESRATSTLGPARSEVELSRPVPSACA